MSVLQKGIVPFVLQLVLLTAAMIYNIKIGNVSGADKKGASAYFGNLFAALAAVIPVMLRSWEWLYGADRYGRTDNIPDPAAMLILPVIYIAVDHFFSAKQLKKSEDPDSPAMLKKVRIKSVICIVVIIIAGILLQVLMPHSCRQEVSLIPEKAENIKIADICTYDDDNQIQFVEITEIQELSLLDVLKNGTMHLVRNAVAIGVRHTGLSIHIIFSIDGEPQNMQISFGRDKDDGCLISGMDPPDNVYYELDDWYGIYQELFEVLQ